MFGGNPNQTTDKLIVVCFSICSAQLEYVTLASTCAKPTQAKQGELLKPTSDQISAVQEFREKNRSSPFFNHLSAISESIPALGWVCVVSKTRNVAWICGEYESRFDCLIVWLYRAQLLDRM